MDPNTQTGWAACRRNAAFGGLRWPRECPVDRDTSYGAQGSPVPRTARYIHPIALPGRSAPPCASRVRSVNPQINQAAFAPARPRLVVAGLIVAEFLAGNGALLRAYSGHGV